MTVYSLSGDETSITCTCAEISDRVLQFRLLARAHPIVNQSVYSTEFDARYKVYRRRLNLIIRNLIILYIYV